MSARERMLKETVDRGVSGSSLLMYTVGIDFLCAEVDRLERLVERLNEHVARLEGDDK